MILVTHTGKSERPTPGALVYRKEGDRNRDYRHDGRRAQQSELVHIVLVSACAPRHRDGPGKGDVLALEAGESCSAVSPRIEEAGDKSIAILLVGALHEHQFN